MCPQQNDVPSSISPIIPESINYYLNVSSATVNSLVSASTINTLIQNNPGTVNTLITNMLTTLGIKNRLIYLKCLAEADALSVKDGLMSFMIPADLDGLNLDAVACVVYTASSSGLPTIQVNLNNTNDMLSTPLTIDANERESYTAATPVVIDASHKTVHAGDIIRIDCDVAGTGTTGLDVILTIGS